MKIFQQKKIFRQLKFGEQLGQVPPPATVPLIMVSVQDNGYT